MKIKYRNNHEAMLLHQIRFHVLYVINSSFFGQNSQIKISYRETLFMFRINKTEIIIGVLWLQCHKTPIKEISWWGGVALSKKKSTSIMNWLKSTVFNHVLLLDSPQTEIRCHFLKQTSETCHHFKIRLIKSVKFMKYQTDKISQQAVLLRSEREHGAGGYQARHPCPSSPEKGQEKRRGIWASITELFSLVKMSRFLSILQLKTSVKSC